MSMGGRTGVARDPNRERLEAALRKATDRLLAMRGGDGSWRGRLSSSALSTATAVSALSIAGLPEDDALVRGGVGWLVQTQNADGGWGDTTDSPSNLSTSLLVRAALALGRQGPLLGDEPSRRLDGYLCRVAGATEDERREAICAAYAPDRTFAVPILTNLALAGLTPWEGVPPLPFELAACPSAWFRFLRLHVVSYALPALIAVGLAIDRHNASRSLLRRWVRAAATGASLRKLENIQPSSGGFLEAVPLTSFVTMSLVSLFGPGQPVARKGLAFLRASAREDGSWPIDSDLSVWITTASTVALAEAGRAHEIGGTRDWILAAQHLRRHPYTDSPPGGWAWTDLPGGVPDADDTAGAILALARASERHAAVDSGVRWLLDLQNSDGGWPTFCRGWGHLPFDRSAPDLTAHVLRALDAADPESSRPDCQRAKERGLRYLQRELRADGSWHPLWFGNQGSHDQTNPVIGTARVLRALALFEPGRDHTRRGQRFLLESQNRDGGWGSAAGLSSTIEETALAVSALAEAPHSEAGEALDRGASYLVDRVEADTWLAAAPIGLYFARLWYSEAAYPAIWTVEALGRVLTRRGAPQSLSGREMANLRVPSGG
ncbi:MAG TPA: prenyltransferase/squalene oxidase repeat-containing protein [Verrucomicrobiae bacterium]|nr:prenyltransferase/squalene oxidase repeat-containing protein [Verrucomicrobiae bacterium]